ncbi:diguanylate cyclase (GGDEF) domain-containing protein [Desulfurobacterium pacificum]|uniref:Diguanylate cyclase (GGDEF) domain-containing protein n=1 Tax=Desulfurobacterium pacificum TaxID=240166 RepID=A0ABY1NPN9_9BACT|nr:GGDEF domain-containing protein [Desulfurobacterium pacificum]SMP14985.1 diguanylate cyclase (GGDEF) domain-containing protein [Desulfurobacterium pacificum]
MREKVKLQLLVNYLDELTRKYDEIFHIKEQLLKELEYQALFDSLTGLYNRNALFSFLERETAKVERGENRLLIIFLDLDNFKRVNDIYGHKKGDEVLRHVAQMLKEHFRKYDILARFGGDEFILGIILPPSSNRKEIEKILKRVENDIEKEFQEFGLSISYGIAVSPDEGKDVQKLIQLADKRMYEMKKVKKQRQN